MISVDSRSETSIANTAISHLGISKEIKNLETEKSEEARACRRYYNLAMEQALRDFPFSFSKRYATLGLVEENPNCEWLYSYRYPSDCLFFRKILSGDRNEPSENRIPFVRASDDQGQLIFTDKSLAECIYTVRIDDPILYPVDFIMTVSLLLAHLASPRLTRGDGNGLGERALKLYLLRKEIAANNSANEEEQDQEPESEFMRARS